MKAVSKIMPYHSEWHHLDSRKITHDLFKVLWRVLERKQYEFLKQSWPNTSYRQVCFSETTFLLYTSQKSPLFFFPPQIFIYGPCIFSPKSNFLVFILNSFLLNLSYTVFLCMNHLLIFITLISVTDFYASFFFECLFLSLLSQFSFLFFVLSLSWVHVRSWHNLTSPNISRMS